MEQEIDRLNQGARSRRGPVPRTGMATLFALMGLLLAHAAPTLAQQHRVSGRVTEAAGGAPLAGVQVVVRGTAARAVTDASGNYTLAAPSSTGTLVFSRIGYADQEAAIGGRNTINVSLAAKAQQLEEIVAIGYGEKRRDLLTESISTVSSEEISRVPVSSVDQALQGRASGVQVTTLSGVPGSPVAVRIRGVSTVGNTQPLFVIDGVPVGRNDAAFAVTNPLATINPADIESISVLKDASAAAVYGVRAANGVVLIQTKKGRLGRPKVTYSGYTGFQNTPALWEMNNTQQYIELTQAAYDAYNQQNNLKRGDKDFRFLHPDLTGNSPLLGINEDWIGDVTNQNAPIQNHNVSVSGATENLNYYISGGYFQQDAIVDKWDLDRFSFRANSDYTVRKWLRVGENFSLSHQNIIRGQNASGNGFLLRNAATMPPFFQIRDPGCGTAAGCTIPNNRYGYNGNFGVAGLNISNENAINAIVDNYDRLTRVLGGLYGEIRLFNDRMTFRSQGSVDLSLNRDDRWSPGYTAQETGLPRLNSEYNDARGEGMARVFTNTLTYDDTFGSHGINLLSGIEVQQIEGTSLSGSGQNFLSTDPNFYRVVKNATTGVALGGGASETAYLGYIGRLSYNFADRYLLTATVRRDGTSRFSPEDNRRWGTFPSVSAAWRISEEPFFSVPSISSLKLRGSWGQLGNAETAAYPHIFRVSTTPDYGLGGSTSVQAPAPINFVNPDIKWETVETADFGVDVSLFNNAVDFLATYYRRTTRDFLVFIPIPQITGFGSAPINAGSVLNKGLEFELGYRTRFMDALDFNVSANLTTIKNELTALTPGIEQFVQNGGYRTAVGFPIGYFYGYRTNGIYQTPEEAAQATKDNTIGSRKPQPGDIRFMDVNGPAGKDAPKGQMFSGEPDGVITPHDRAYLGKTIPDFFYGFNFDATFRRFDASVLFQGVQGVEIYNEFRAQAESLQGGGRNQLVATQNRWTGPGTSNTIPRAVQNDPNQNARFSDRWIEDGSFLRLRNVQLGYQLPERLLGGIATDARVYVSASNLLTFTRYSGLDPEVFTWSQQGSGTQIGAGTDQGNIPQPRVFQIGLTAGF